MALRFAGYRVAQAIAHSGKLGNFVIQFIGFLANKLRLILRPALNIAAISAKLNPHCAPVQLSPKCSAPTRHIACANPRAQSVQSALRLIKRSADAGKPVRATTSPISICTLDLKLT